MATTVSIRSTRDALRCIKAKHDGRVFPGAYDRLIVERVEQIHGPSGSEVRMRPVLAALCAAMIIPAVAKDGPGEFPDDLEQWIAVAPPAPGSNTWFVANHDTAHEWVVSLARWPPVYKATQRVAQSPGRAVRPAPLRDRAGLGGVRGSLEHG